MSKLAFMTFSVLRAPYGDPLIQEFDDRTPDVFKEAEMAPGFIARAVPSDDVEWKTNHQKNWGRWGPFAVPRFYLGGIAPGHSTQAQTLTIWKDLGSVWRFVYRGPLHRSALQERHRWFGPQAWPIYGVWWTPDHRLPIWPEACERLEHLHDHGPTPRCFTFKSMFDAEGAPISNEILRGSAEQAVARSG